MSGKKIDSLPYLYHPLRLLCAFYHRLYYRRFRVTGKENIPSGTPVIFASCHQNALMDALAVLFASGRQTVFLARADIFKKKSMAGLLRFLRILPVYRIRDGYSSLGQNQETFDEVNQVLRQKIPIGIFPEGLHLGMKKLKPLRKGIARMAFQAESESEFKLGLQIVPVGLDYSDYYKAGADLLVVFGKPLIVADYANQFQENPAVAINQFMEDLTAALRRVMIDIQPDEKYEEIRLLADRIVGAGYSGKKSRSNLNTRFILTKQIADKFNEAEKQGASALNAVWNEMTSQINPTLTASPGISPKEMTSRFNTPARMPSLLKNAPWLLLLTLSSPIALYGAILNSVPFFIPEKLTRNINDPHFVSSVRFVTSFLLFLIWQPMLIMMLFIFLDSIPMILAIAASLPASAWMASLWWRLFRSLNVQKSA
jgi:1-acyl-sn-glycerol-3-phosphate acyltransferase